MPNKLIGTLIALFIFGSALNISIIFFTPCHANAQLSELSEIQNSTFHLSHKNMGITSETFKTDKYIDNWQAEYISDLSKPELNTPADKNYPFSLVDSYLLDTDLEIDYEYEYILGPFPQRAYLSRNDYSLAGYEGQQSPPAFRLTEIKALEPFTEEEVKAVSWVINNYQYQKAEILHNYYFNNGPFSNMNYCGPDGYVIDTTVRILSGNVAVWVDNVTEYYLQPRPTEPCTDCLPKSSCPESAGKIKKWPVPYWQPITPVPPTPPPNCTPSKQSSTPCSPCLSCK